MYNESDPLVIITTPPENISEAMGFLAIEFAKLETQVRIAIADLVSKDQDSVWLSTYTITQNIRGSRMSTRTA